MRQKNPERALVVDDDPEICELLKRVLQVKELQVDVAMNGKEAMDLVRANTYQLALVDIMLPDVSGIDLMGDMRSVAPSTQFIIVSGYVTLLNAMAAMHKGAFSMILKPIEDVQALLDEIELALGRTRRWRQMFSQLQRLKKAANGDRS